VFANKFASQQRVDLDQMQGRLESVISLHSCGSSLTKPRQTKWWSSKHSAWTHN